MPLAMGSRVGLYDIIALLGAGGMGEVYRAKDTKLGREVALKILPATFTSDPDRLARFRREAQVLAALNHPHIGAIYGLDEANGTQFLVLELVDGESLDKRIARGKIPVDEALGIARQIAEALEAAHEKGIIHRDLKPANIALTTEGNVKVLDFGLAKATDPASGASLDVTNSPTITTPAMMTGVGVILGTAAYMSPEQAKGRPADKRSDVWAFGCVLYEMLTSKRAFEGDDVSDALAAVLRGQPDWSSLPRDLSGPIRLLLHRCLEKDRSRRASDIGIARFLITEPSLATGERGAPAPQPVSPSLWKRAVIVAGSAAAGAALGIAVWAFRSPVPPTTVTRFSYRLPDDQRFTNTGRQVLAISPDGTRLAYIANQRLYLKTMWEADARLVVGQQLGGITSPVFSPDNQWIAYWSSSGTVNKVAITGGAPVKLADVDNPIGMSWNGDSLLIGQGGKGIVRVPDKGGPPEAVIRVKDDEIAHGPQLLPDGRSILFTLASGTEQGRWDDAQIVVQTIGSTDRKTIIRGGSDARYVRTGHILYVVGGVLFAEPFDIRKLESVGGPISVVEGVAGTIGAQTGSSQSAVSNNGTLVYLPGPTISGQGGSEIAWVDLKGNVKRLKPSPRIYQSPRVSPNGQQLAIGVDDGRAASIWVYDLDEHTQIRQLTIGGNNRFPIWTPVGARITFQSDREGDRSIFWQRADGKGPAELLIKAAQGEALIPDSWSPDGDALLFSARTGARTFALRTFTIHDRRSLAFGDLRSNNEPQAGFSKDGRWVAYALGGGPGSGVSSVYVRPFPINDELHLIAPGVSPFWARDSMSLYFVSSPGVAAFSVVNVRTDPVFGASEPSAVPRPSVLGGGPNLPRAYDIAPDGQHLILLTAPESPSSAAAAAQIHVVLNWTEELKQRVPTK
jgi:serine/threonine protein kinase/Tol biopolymer transport system component